jgi:putative membrane protein
MRAFFDPELKGQVKAAIVAVEAQTSAELVVSVKPRSGHYRDVRYLIGVIAAYVTLCVLLFAPQDFETNFMPAHVVLAFALGAVIGGFALVTRAFTTQKRRDAQVATAGKATFVDLGVSRTSGRNGVLVYVSVNERAAEVVCDVGVKPGLIADGIARIKAAVAGGDANGFVAALHALGPALGAAMPRQADDVNELSDEVDA